MAPLRQLVAAIEDFRLASSLHGGFAMEHHVTGVYDFRGSQLLAVMCVSLSFAALSVAAALFAFYWFIRMRRGFRQDMIMLLIQSDMAKGLWLIISPLFYFITGHKPFYSNGIFCQVSGFFLTATIEASDIAVLLIAIHTILFIVKRQHPGVPVGLEPYRRVAYVVWATVPLILAAIVPITGGRFVDTGPHCYLPVQPTWYRSALSWFPRYTIFGFILVTYTSLYLYVYLRFRKFGEYQRTVSNTTSHSSAPSLRRSRRRFQTTRIVPPTPPIVTHGLLNEPRNDASKPRQHSGTWTVSAFRFVDADGSLVPPENSAQRQRGSISWSLVDFGRDGSISPRCITPADESVTVSPRTSMPPLFRSSSNSNIPAVNLLAPTPTHARAKSFAAGDSNALQLGSLASNRHGVWRSRANSLNRNTASQSDPVPNFFAALRQQPLKTESVDERGTGADIRSPTPSVHLPSGVSDEAMRRSRDRMRRQMRLLFIYPAIYVLTWVAPFVEHLYTYDAINPSAHPPLNATASAAHAFPSPAASLGLAFHSLANATISTPSEGFAQLNEPFALRIISMASLCIGAAVDCGFFTTWEKPWKNLRVGFWDGLGTRLRLNRVLCGLSGDKGDHGWAPGRDRDERLADERVAWRRREREREMAWAALRSEPGSLAPERRSEGELSRVSNRAARARREWWDALDVDDD
ncbi:hypothetical protein F5Y17DRAFT_14969 [Xylariaceae sp. FL0594]|nr:hypothetical protein F5Y17DRAFT_14969 [Xylariaceae sp. FL0594]